MIEQGISSDQLITLSERIEMLRIARDKIKAAKMAMEDVAVETAELEEEGTEIEEI